jgi:HAD superfamily hydrolase (TIGR01509 family)
MLKAILFDLDGTLINSEHFYFECWNEILAEWGAALTFHDWVNNYAGVPVYQNAKRLIATYGITTPFDELIARRENLTIERFKTTDVLMMPYAMDIIRFFAEKGLTMAIVTSSLRQDVDAIFERNGLSHYFKLIITRSEITNGKPHPEGYNLCRETLGLAKEECLAFEDTINGLTAAKAAGLVCYAVQSNTDEHHKLTAADKLFLDFKEVLEYLNKAKSLL